MQQPQQQLQLKMKCYIYLNIYMCAFCVYLSLSLYFSLLVHSFKSFACCSSYTCLCCKLFSFSFSLSLSNIYIFICISCLETCVYMQTIHQYNHNKK